MDHIKLTKLQLKFAEGMDELFYTIENFVCNSYPCPNLSQGLSVNSL